MNERGRDSRASSDDIPDRLEDLPIVSDIDVPSGEGGSGAGGSTIRGVDNDANSIKTVVAIALGGACGTLTRVFLATQIPTAAPSFPWATFLANLGGAFLIGLIITLVVERLPPTRYVRYLLGTGFCGGLTTFSTFMVEVVLLIQRHRIATAGSYTALSLVAGLILVRVGMSCARLAPRWGAEAT